MENKNFDSKQDLKTMSIDRLFVLQKMLLRDIRCCLEGNDLYDKNDLYSFLSELEVINYVITKKISMNKKLYV